MISVKGFVTELIFPHTQSVCGSKEGKEFELWN